MREAEDDVVALRAATGWVVTELGEHPDTDLSVRAGPVDWSCWTTLDHVADCQLAYALQVASGYTDDYLPVHGGGHTDDFVHFQHERGVPGVTEVLPAFAEVLCATALAAPGYVRAYHPFGESDPAGFAAMGAVEMLVHGHDVLAGIGRTVALPESPATSVLRRLFPHVEMHDAGAGPTLRWATGRTDLPGRERVTRWRWDGTVGDG